MGLEIWKKKKLKKNKQHLEQNRRVSTASGFWRIGRVIYAAPRIFHKQMKLRTLQSEIDFLLRADTEHRHSEYWERLLTRHGNSV